MDTSAPCSSGNAGNKIGQLRGGLDRLSPPRLVDGQSDAPCSPLLPVLPQNPFELANGSSVNKPERVESLASVHAHIEPRPQLKAETAICRPDVMRRQPQIQKHPVDLVPTDFFQDLSGFGEIGPPRNQTLAELLQPLLRRGDRFPIPIQTQDSAIRAAVSQDLGRMTSPSQRSIEVPSMRFRPEKLHHLLHHYGHMPVIHPPSSFPPAILDFRF